MRRTITDAFAKRIRPPTDRPYEDHWDAALPGFGLRVSAKGRKAWHLKTRVDGKQRRFAVGNYPAMSLATARRKANDFIDAISKGCDPKRDAERKRRETERAEANTFAAVADLFLKVHVDKKLRPSVRYEVRRAFRSDLMPKFGKLPVTEITRSDIHRFLDKKALTAPVMANRLQSYLSRFFSWAVDREDIVINPCARMEFREKESQRKRDRVLSDDEVADLWMAAKTMGHPFGTCFQLLLLTGQRRGEVAGMARSELDLDAATWTIPTSRMKAKKPHSVPLSPQSTTLLQSLKPVSDLVFTTTGTGPIRGFGKMKTDLAKHSGVTNWRLHDARRTFATGVRRLGADRLVVAKLLHHTDASVTALYDHFALEQAQKDAVEAWGRHIDSLTMPLAKHGTNHEGRRRKREAN